MSGLLIEIVLVIDECGQRSGCEVVGHLFYAAASSYRWLPRMTREADCYHHTRRRGGSSSLQMLRLLALDHYLRCRHDCPITTAPLRSRQEHDADHASQVTSFPKHRRSDQPPRLRKCNGMFVQTPDGHQDETFSTFVRRGEYDKKGPFFRAVRQLP